MNIIKWNEHCTCKVIRMGFYCDHKQETTRNRQRLIELGVGIEPGVLHSRCQLKIGLTVRSSK